MKKFIDDPLPPLEDLVRIFCRVLELKDINNQLNFTFLRTFYYTFRIGGRLASGPSVNLIETVFQCLMKHEFNDQDFHGKMQESWCDFLSRGMFSPLTCDQNKN